MKKNLLILAVASLALFAVGCSGGGDGAPDKPLEGKPEETQIQSAPGEQRPGGAERDGG